jgi:hypothetical protein
MIGSMRQWLAFAAGSVCVIGSVIFAASVRAPLVGCSRPGGAPPLPCPQPANDVPLLRAGIVAAGLLIAGLIVVGSRIWSRRHR